MILTINGTDPSDLGLAYLSRTIAEAEPKTNKVSIPLRDGDIDLTEELSGVPRYNNREIVITFELMTSRTTWLHDIGMIQKAFHGKTVKVIFADDPAFYWSGRCSVGALDDHGSTAGLTLTIDATPFKRTSDVVTTQTVTVSGETTVTVKCLNMRNYPKFTPSASMTVSDGVETYTITETAPEAYGMQFESGDQTLVFDGSGTCEIDIYGGEL